MDFQIASDLHLDTRGGIDADESVLPKRNAPILILAGDLASASDPDYPEMLAKVAEPFDAVLYIPGNHEYYDSNTTVARMDERIEEICYSIGNVIYMNKRRIDINGFAYIGATLWTNCPNDPTPLNDFSHIDNGRFTPAEENRMHREHRDYIKKAVNYAKRDGLYGAVVMSHHAPDRALERDVLSRPERLFPYYFASDMSGVVHDPFINVWVHGHTHESYRMEIDRDGTIFASNALGYENEITGYTNDAVLRI